MDSLLYIERKFYRSSFLTGVRAGPRIQQVKALSHSIVIIRHLKERRSKCSVQPFIRDPGFTFYNARPGFVYDATGHIMLSLDAPQLTVEDGVWEAEEPRGGSAGCPGVEEQGARACPVTEKRPLLLLDSTWRRLPNMAKCVSGMPLRRSLPDWVRTAYPRIGQFQEDPEVGLSTVEALYLALRLLGEDRADLLDRYHWKSLFLRQFDDRGCFE